MTAALATQPGLQASVSLINLDTGKEYDAGSSDAVFTAASTAKLVAVFDYLHQVELGKATLTRQLGGVSAQENIRRMIVNSDNDAWARLNQYLTFRGEQAYLQSLGVSGVVQANNMQFTTPNMAKLLQWFYTGQLMNAVHQQLLYGYLANTTVHNLIQAAVPATATVYHKYGQLGGNLHDAAIVQYAGHNFVLVIYTNNPGGSNRYNDQVNLIHAVTAAALQSMAVS
jgi:beta-lactamase class A